MWQIFFVDKHTKQDLLQLVCKVHASICVDEMSEHLRYDQSE